MYDEMQLSPVDTSSVGWALATLRFILHDTNNDQERYSDAELTMSLELHAFTPDTVTYYRPHVVAAHLIQSDPDRAVTESIDNASETKQTPATIAAGVLRAWRSIDDAIFAASEYRPASPSFAVIF